MSIETKDALKLLNHKLMVQPVIIEDIYDSENSEFGMNMMRLCRRGGN